MKLDAQRMALEVAAAISEGYSIEQIRSEMDLTAFELEEILETQEFKEKLKSYGQNVVDLWEEHRTQKKTSSVDRRISEQLDTYYDELHELAMGNSLKPEKRADILLKFMDRAAPPEREEKRVRMPPALIDNWARREAEYEAAKAQEQRRNSDRGRTPSAGEDEE